MMEDNDVKYDLNLINPPVNNLNFIGAIVSINVDLSAYYTKTEADDKFQTKANLVTSVSAASTDSQYPSAKLFYDTCGDIESLINAL